MGEELALAWLGRAVDGMALGYITFIVGRLTAWLTGIAAAAMTLWIIFAGGATAAGFVANSVATLTSQLFKKVWVLAFSTMAAVYMGTVVNVTNAMADGMASLFLPPDAIMKSTAQSVWDVMTAFDEKAWDMVSQIGMSMSVSLKLPIVILAMLLVAVGTLALEVAALYVCFVAKIHRTFILAIGPLFILTLMHKETAGFFKAWLHLLASTVVLILLVFFVLGFGMFAGGRLADGVVYGLDADNLLKLCGTYCAVMLGLGLVLVNAPAWATALTGGAPMQMGTSLMQQAANTYLLARANRQGGGNLGNTAGNASGSYGLGLALGSMAGDAARTAYQHMAALGRSRRS
jgi:type IV secretion system protein VirB6